MGSVSSAQTPGRASNRSPSACIRLLVPGFTIPTPFRYPNGRFPDAQKTGCLRFCSSPSLPARAGGSGMGKESIMTRDEHQRCLDACVQCAQECEYCADACISEHRAECARICLDCAQTCWFTASFFSRRSSLANDVSILCARICELCAAECHKYKSEHTRHCAQACQRCASECRKGS